MIILFKYFFLKLQSGRTRKCSIVQEEDDEEELSSCSGRDDMSSPLNRRGSRSEGRLNIAVQDRIVESERLKKESHHNIPVSKITDGISGVTLVTSDINNLNDRLGGAGRGGILKQHCADFRPRTADVSKNTNHSKGGKLTENSDRSLSVDKGLKSIKDQEIINTKFLVDSSTISIPLSNTSQIANSVPKYKTMPSPTRPNTILTGTNCLNEIFEEGTDVGSSDSATTTPRPISRQNHFVTNRTQSQGSSSTSTTTTTTSQRRSKFHKTRTTSCSSSDASDDDSENRKKRAHKIVDVTKPIQYRRDSHDDSSDSQDPGNASATGSNATSSPIVHITTSTTTNSTTHQDSTSNQQSGQQPNGRAKNVQQIGGFRRHRAGRRRSGETRLRESQSLNRITEVQESEITLSALAHHPAPPAITVNPPVPKPKGFSARLFQGFRNKSDNNASHQSHAPQDKPRVPSQTEPPDDDIDMVISPELAKALRATETKNSSSTTKKLKILGKYFQVSFVLYLLLQTYILFILRFDKISLSNVFFSCIIFESHKINNKSCVIRVCVFCNYFAKLSKYTKIKILR